MNRLDVYVDGSFSSTNIYTTYGGIVILQDGIPVFSQRVEVKDQKMTKMRNVGGELVAAVLGISNAAHFLEKYSNDDPFEVYVYHDYVGIEKFALTTGAWNAKELGSLEYQKYIIALRKQFPQMNLHFVKVKAHTGNKWNEEADAVANGVVSSNVAGSYKGCIKLEDF